MKEYFTSEHGLAFEIAEWIFDDFVQFRIGTCHGLWGSTETTYDILAVKNEVLGNGHFDDVMEWFEMSCRRDKKDLRFLEVWNHGLKIHLIGKRGFEDAGKDILIKKFR